MLDYYGKSGYTMLSQPLYLQDGIKVGVIVTGKEHALQAETQHKPEESLSFVDIQGCSHPDSPFLFVQAHVGPASRFFQQAQDRASRLFRIGAKAIVYRPPDALPFYDYARQGSQVPFRQV